MIILDVFLCFFPLAARVPIEEKVETKKVEMREEIPTKGMADLNVFLLQLTALSCKKYKLIRPSSTTKIFDCFVLFRFVIPLPS